MMDPHTPPPHGSPPHVEDRWDTASNQTWPRRHRSKPPWVAPVRAGLILLLLGTIMAVLIPSLFALAGWAFDLVRHHLDAIGPGGAHGPLYDLAVLCAILIASVGFLRILTRHQRR